MNSQEIQNLKSGFSLENLKDFYFNHHNTLENKKDQTWYFALADCNGLLEIFTDDALQREHLLGLKTFWKDIDN